jgi:hypothetical protein
MRNTFMLSALLALACSGGASPPERPGRDGAEPGAADVVIHEGLEYRATTAVMESFPVQLATTVTVTNRGAETVSLILPDGCAVLLRAYRDGAATTPAYDAGGNTICTAALQEFTIQPNATQQLQGRSDAREILGDSLPDGSYQLRALVRPNGGQVEVPAGRVELAVPR